MVCRPGSEKKPIRNTGIKWKEDLVHKQKPYDVSDTRGGVFGRMGEKRELKRARVDRREEETLNFKALMAPI